MTLHKTLTQLTTAFSAVRPREEPPRATRGNTDPATDHNAKVHDYILFKSLLDSLTDLAQSRLIGIIRNRKRLIETLAWKSISVKAHSVVGISHTQAVT